MAKRVDDNQPMLVEQLRALGCSVQSLADLGKGCPDLLVAHSGTNYLFEVKTAKGTVNQMQVEWHRRWQAKVYVVRSIDDCLAIFNKPKPKQ